MSDFGMRMEEARLALSEAEGGEVSWNEIERRAEINRGDASKYKYGREPPRDVLLRLANALGCDVTWLSWGQGRMHPPRQLIARTKPKDSSDDDPDPPSESGVRPSLHLTI